MMALTPSPPPPFPNPFASLNAALQWIGYRFDRLENRMSQIDTEIGALTAAEDKLDADMRDMSGRVNASLAQLTAAQQQIADLQAQVAAGSTVSAADLQKLEAAVTQATSVLQTEDTVATSLDAPPAPAPTDTTNPPAPPSG